MKEKNEIDILIPVFNEDETIVKTLKNILAAVKCNYKILICYDYDEDPTLKIIKDNFSNNEKILFVKNFSQGFNNALVSGFRHSSAEAVLFLWPMIILITMKLTLVTKNLKKAIR